MARHTGSLELRTRHSYSESIELSRLPAALDRAMLQGTIDAADDLYEAIRLQIPRSDGPGPHAQDSWRRRIIPYANGALVVLFTEDEVAYYYWSGTKAHPIAARFAKALRFAWPNAPAAVGPPAKDGHYYFSSIWHPGTQRHPYVELAGGIAGPAMRERYEDAVSRVISSE